jgi:hypothetical protein
MNQVPLGYEQKTHAARVVHYIQKITDDAELASSRLLLTRWPGGEVRHGRLFYRGEVVYYTAESAVALQVAREAIHAFSFQPPAHELGAKYARGAQLLARGESAKENLRESSFPESPSKGGRTFGSSGVKTRKKFACYDAFRAAGKNHKAAIEATADKFLGGSKVGYENFCNLLERALKRRENRSKTV